MSSQEYRNHTADDAMTNKQNSRQFALLTNTSPGFIGDDTLRKQYTDRLRERLRDPQFRSQLGFPQASDEVILALSDPPFYTACPNPFIKELIDALPTRQQGDRVPHEPYTTDVQEGKGDALYNVHGYHTKVPHKAVLRYLLHYSQPGDVILDGFCGSGMAGVAAQIAASPPPELKHEVEAECKEQAHRAPSWGKRHVVLADLSPAATFISNSYNNPEVFERCITEAEAIIEGLEREWGWMYETRADRRNARVEYTIWSDVFVCPHCGTEMVYWEVAVDQDRGEVREIFNCPKCKTELNKRALERAWDSTRDRALKRTVRQPKQVPVVINYSFAGSSARFHKPPSDYDKQVLDKIEGVRDVPWYPTAEFPDGEKTGEPIRLGLRSVHQMFTRRNLYVFAALWKALPPPLRWLVTGTLQRGSKQHQIAISRIGGPKKGVGGATAGHRRGTLYVPSNQVEMNVFALVRERIAAIRRARYSGAGRPLISTGSAAALPLSDDSVDYVFTDPPFGANIMYWELSFLWEAWLQAFTARESEAIESRTLGKTLMDYQHTMRECFSEYLRVLKPGRWMTVEFSNTRASVWNAIQTALEQAGFVVANVSALSKGRGGLNAIVGTTAVNQDLVISCYKPKPAVRDAMKDAATRDANVWQFISSHLEHLAVFHETEGRAVELVERMARTLYDRLVAFCVGNSFPVPISSPDFQSELSERYPERDGMYFLPGQVQEYDRRRMSVKEFLQLELFVTDEASAIQWLKQQLKQKPQTMQELNPQFMKEISGWQEYEEARDLLRLLQDNFLRYEGAEEVPSQIHAYLSSNFKELRNQPKTALGLRERAKERWYVPDPTKQSDLDRLRERSLLREFEGYRATKQRSLKVFRTEAVRAGFKAAYDRQDYKTIVEVAAKLPEPVLQEDEKLLMYYDVATMRLGDEGKDKLFH
jgi:ribosomal protein L37AE/L43A